jgi:ketosteroid isomerase-like protein
LSQENINVVRELLAAWSSRDLERWLGCWDAECVWLPKLRAELEGTRTYRGHDGLRRYWDGEDAIWSEFVVEPYAFREIGDEVLAMARGSARGKQSGLEIDGPFAFRFRFVDGKVVQGESYLDVDEALEAAGLS